MKKQYTVPLILTLCLLSGCSQDPSAQTKRTQPVIQETTSSAAAKASALPETSLAPESSLSPGSALLSESSFGMLTEYCTVKTQIELLKAKRSILESDYRIGAVKEDSFHSQKEELNLQKDRLEREKDRLEDQILPDPSYYGTYEGQSMDELIEAYHRQKDLEDQAENQEELLTRQFIAGQVSEEDFLAQLPPILLKKEQADMEADILEDILERMGWDN